MYYFCNLVDKLWREIMRYAVLSFLFIACLFAAPASAEDNSELQTIQAQTPPLHWLSEWRDTDFSKYNIDFDDILEGGPQKDGIPSIDDPIFTSMADMIASGDLPDDEPVIGLIINGEAKAYPLRILIWHELVNDEVGGVPILASFCPLCNAAIVYDRRLDGNILDFGTSGKLRRSDMVMYDRQTESWWQQFIGEGIIGSMTGKRLRLIPSRLESFAQFRERVASLGLADEAQILVPNDANFRPYGANPYVGYDSSRRPFLYGESLPEGIAPLARVVSLEGRDEAWSLDMLRENTPIELEDGTIISWQAGQVSALDARQISDSRDVGTITAQKDGEDIPYFVDFAFAFHAFYPESVIHGAVP